MARVRALGTFVMLSLATLAGPASAWQAPTVDDAAALIADLASDDWQTRTEATTALIGITRELPADRALRTLEVALTSWMASHADSAKPGDLTEVIARFESAAIGAFFLAPRSGLGINYDPSQPVRGVMLGGTVEPFDAHGKLRAGDVILEISGVPIENGQRDLSVAIASHLPGEQAMIVLDRGSERVRIPVTIGRREDLRTGQTIGEDVLRLAWAQRSARLMGQTVRGSLDALRPRLVYEAAEGPAPSRTRVARADVTLGGQPGVTSARRVGVLTTFSGNENDARAALLADLNRVNRELALVNRRVLELANIIAQIDLELRVTPDTQAGRAQADALQKRRVELLLELSQANTRQGELLRLRAEFAGALSQ